MQDIKITGNNLHALSCNEQEKALARLLWKSFDLIDVGDALVKVNEETVYDEKYTHLEWKIKDETKVQLLWMDSRHEYHFLFEVDLEYLLDELDLFTFSTKDNNLIVEFKYQNKRYYIEYQGNYHCGGAM